jgi:hypothetical protein
MRGALANRLLDVMPNELALRYRASSIIVSYRTFSRGKTMSKNKGSGGFRGRDSKTGQPIQIPQIKRPTAPSVPRVMPRTKASPKGR